MATSTRRSCKLQEFTAHASNVNCVALGRKSGHVLVTGGDDKKVNLWAIGKKNCLMSLSGHTSPVECVKFGLLEDVVCAGSQLGQLKMWDLEHSKLSRTMNGHKAAIKCMDFRLFGEMFASGSLDTAINLWDIRRKICIFTYKGHEHSINSLKFSPDGNWIASADVDGVVKLWDLRMGKLLQEFLDHRGSAVMVDFHPQEFLLASGSSTPNAMINFWDLESFKSVSSMKLNNQAMRCICFSSGGECLFAGGQDSLEIYGWEPERTLDSIAMGWGKVQDIAITDKQLIGASFQNSNIVVHACDLTKTNPLGNKTNAGSNFIFRNSFGKSYPEKKATNLKKDTISTKTIEEVGDKSSTNQNEEITHPITTDYRDIFQPNKSLSRTPPPIDAEVFTEPPEEDPTQPQIIRKLSTSMSNLITNAEPEEESESPTISLTTSSSVSIPKPVPVRVHPIKSPPVQRTISSTNQIRASLQANSMNGSRNTRNLAPVPPLRQNITPLPGKKTIPTISHSTSQPLGPQRSNSTLTPRVAPMAAVSPVIDDGQLKTRAASPDANKIYIKKQQNNMKNGTEPGYEADYPVQINHIRHCPSDSAINRTNSAQNRTTVTRNIVTSISSRNLAASSKKVNKAQVAPNPKVEIKIARPIDNNSEPQQHLVDFVPMSSDKPYGLDIETFLPNNCTGSSTLGFTQMGVLSEMSEAEVLNSIMGGHESMMTVLTSRHRSLQIIYSCWHNKDHEAAIESAVAMNNLSVIVDLLGVLILKPNIWTLDLCNSLLTPIGELLQSKYEAYMTAACSALRIILINFAAVIKSNVEAPLHTIGVDVSREERYHKCLSCYEKIMSIRGLITKKQCVPGKWGATFRELSMLMNTLDT